MFLSLQSPRTFEIFPLFSASGSSCAGRKLRRGRGKVPVLGPNLERRVQETEDVSEDPLRSHICSSRRKKRGERGQGVEEHDGSSLSPMIAGSIRFLRQACSTSLRTYTAVHVNNPFRAPEF